MEEISRWLNKATDYNHGVDLLESNGGNSTLLLMLKTGESNFNKAKLIEALEAIVKKADPPSPPDETKLPEVPKTEPEPAAKTLSQSKVAELEEDRKLLYKKQSDAHSQLRLMVQLNYSQKERRKKCFDILDIGKEIRAIGLIIYQIKTHGTIPKKVLKVEELSPADQYRRLTNNRSYISKFSEDPNKAEEVELRTMENLSLKRLLKI